MDRKFTKVDEITRQYRRFNTVGTQLTVRLLPLPADTVRPVPPSTDENTTPPPSDTLRHLLASSDTVLPLPPPTDTVSPLPPPSDEKISNPISQFLDSVTDLCE